MKALITLVTLALSLTGCMTNSSAEHPRETTAIEKLAWLKQANPEADVEQALSRHDKRLWVFARRGARIPGIDPEQESFYRGECGVRQLPGSGDVVYGDSHLELLQQLQRYAEAYNRLMLPHCLQ